MGLRLTGYSELTPLRASSHATVYATTRQIDMRPVVAKVFDLEGEEVEARVEHEFALLEGLQVKGVVRALALQRVGEQLVLLLERAPGVNLATYAQGQPLDLERFANIAVQLAEILGRVHARRVIHRDIKPTNILIDPASGEVHLADFGISVLLERERRHVYDPDVIEGTLPYLSPEQTGRTKRPVDFRSDLYSLGVTFYELLTGRRPFVYDEPLELIHAHLARTPEPPQRLRPDLPDGFARVVIKLLAKAPEHRYQTATGLAADLRALQERLARGDPGTDLALGLEDFANELRLPHELHGRAREQALLLEALEQVMRRAEPRLLVLAGPAGIGKSALISNFEGEVVRVGSYVAHGRFEAEQARPYSAIVEAFTGLVEQLLTESEVRLARWRRRLEVALGGIAGVVIELVPRLGAVLGEMPELAILDPRAGRNRLELAISRFLSVFCEDQRPLVLALEDLQWADDNSLALLESLFVSGVQGPLLVLASVHEAGLAAGHSVRGALDRLPSGQVEVERLGPLSRDAVEGLLADTLGRPRVEVQGFAGLVARKTDNNPLFIRQLLEHLAVNALLRPSPRGWIWDDAALEGTTMPDNALAVMQAKLDELGEELGALMQRAACIGERFDLPTLELVVPRSRSELVAGLYELVELGLLDRLGDEYRFAHDGLRGAARAGAGAALASELRWRIAQHLRVTGATQTTAQLFELVEHLDAGLDGERDLANEDERASLAGLFARAGRGALDSAAHHAALRYLERGLALMADLRASVASRGEASPHYALLVELCYARAQVLAVCGQDLIAATAYVELLDWPLGDGDRGRVGASWVTQLNLMGRSAEAVAHGLELMARFGCQVEPSPSRLRMRALLDRAQARTRKLDDQALLDMPLCVEASAWAVMDVLDATKNATYIHDRQLYVVLIATHVRWFLRHGAHPSAPLALAQLGISLGGFHQVEEALRLSELALRLSERFAEGPATIRAACATQLFITHLGRPFAEPIARMRELYPRALELGDFLWAGYAGAVGLSMQLEVGTHLTVLRRLCGAVDRELGARASAEASVVTVTLGSLATILSGSSDDELGAGDSHTRAALDPEALEARGASRYSVSVAAANLALVKLLLDDPGEALRLCLWIFDEIEQVLFASWLIPRVALTILVAAASLADAGEVAPPQTAAATRRARKLIERWAQGSTDNYAHYRDLAEGLRASGREAERSLERARATAAKRGCRWVEGVAAEQLARLAERDGLPGFAEGARRQAYAAYEAWGARAKLDQLRLVLGEIVDAGPRGAAAASGSWARPSSASMSRGSWTRTASTPSSSASALDFDSVLRAVALIAADLRLDEVIASVLEAALTIAGADHGALVLERGGVLGIVAEAELDERPRVFASPVPLRETGGRAPSSLIHFVLRTVQALVIDEVRDDSRFFDDPYLVGVGARSLLGMPITLAKRTLGVLVLENRLSPGCFTVERFDALQLIAGQAARALDRARIHGALRQSEARWRSLVDGVPDLIALIGEGGEAEFVNRSARHHASGLDHGRLLQRFADVPCTPSWREALATVLGGGPLQELELELLGEAPDDPSNWYVARIAPIELDDDARGSPELDEGELDLGASRMAIVIATDISARKRAEAETARLETQLRQQQRLESIGTLASGVAHEINNPIQGIMNYAELIGGNVGDAALVSEFADEIRVESERVATIVRSLLAFSRREQQQPIEQVSLRELVGATVSLAHALMRKDHIEIVVSIPEDLPLVRCRPQQIQQIIMNLLTNARDALCSGDPDRVERIELRAELRAGDDEDDRRQWLRVTVEDWGTGIPPDVLPHIFDPFFTTKGRDRGTGLGLAVSHGIARDHDGDLSVDSRPGEGTRFYLDLPFTTPD